MAIGSRLQHVIESQQFSRPLLEELLDRAEEIKGQPHHFSGRLNGQVMAALFYEPSTRTRLSFEAAMLRLGGDTVGTGNAREFSSAAKGETLEDTIRIVSGYADVIVLRHNGIALAMQQAFWDKYGLGKSKDVKHPVTQQGTDRNPALLSSKRSEPVHCIS